MRTLSLPIMPGGKRVSVVLILILTVPLTYGLAGCFSCDTHARQLTWNQDDVPIPPGWSSEHSTGDLGGGIARDKQTGELMLFVHGKDPVSHDKAVAFGKALFADRGWPEPRFEGAEEFAYCADVV